MRAARSNPRPSLRRSADADVCLRVHAPRRGAVAMLTQLLSIPLSLAQLLLADRAATPLATTLGVLRRLDARTAAVLLATSALAALLGRCYARCYMLASATAVTIAGNVNKALAILLSVLLFGASMTLVQFAGLLVCLLGALAFSLLGHRRARTTRTESS